MQDVTARAQHEASRAQPFAARNGGAPAPQGGGLGPFLAVRDLIEELSRRLYGARSFARALHAWCDEHHLSSGPIGVIRHQQGPVAAITPDTLAKLSPTPGEPIYYRRVQLVRGRLILAEADNWFMPHRLLQGMRDALENTDMAFEIVVEPLKPSRHSFYLQSWYPEPGAFAGREASGGAGLLLPPDIISEHRAMIIAGNGEPLAILRERCRRELISFALPF
jgi:hypothetical protein